MGTLNLITSDVRRRAVGLVREGVTISIGSNLSPKSTPYSNSLEEHQAYTDPATPMAVADSMNLRIHGWSTHLDALGHIYNGGVGYNGRLKRTSSTQMGSRSMRSPQCETGSSLEVCCSTSPPRSAERGCLPTMWSRARSSTRPNGMRKFTSSQATACSFMSGFMLD